MINERLRRIFKIERRLRDLFRKLIKKMIMRQFRFTSDDVISWNLTVYMNLISQSSGKMGLVQFRLRVSCLDRDYFLPHYLVNTEISEAL